MNKEVPSCEKCVHRKSGISAFSSLDEGNTNSVSKKKSCIALKKGEVLFKEGHSPTGVYCIHNGTLKLSKLGTEGKEQIIRFVQAGDIIGYRSLLSNESLSVTASSLGNTSCCFIPKSVLFEAIQKNPKFSMDLMKRACHELGEATKLITNMAQKSVRERVAEILLMLHSSFGQDEEGFINISLTREEIANMAGTATESLIRLLSDFKNDEYILLSGRKIKLLDLQGLSRVGNIYD